MKKTRIRCSNTKFVLACSVTKSYWIIEPEFGAYLVNIRMDLKRASLLYRIR